MYPFFTHAHILTALGVTISHLSPFIWRCAGGPYGYRAPSRVCFPSLAFAGVSVGFGFGAECQSAFPVCPSSFSMIALPIRGFESSVIPPSPPWLLNSCSERGQPTVL
ncbi:hypothetical protein B0H13DRAFT_2276234 [Mycena leptocephala]|nr:hypothetical protein B0H13DRAFT_2276234 [Mycena leptocephala]